MARSLTKKIDRQIDSFLERGRPIVIRVTDSGIYIKRARERWSSAVLCTWAAAFSTACKLKVQEEKRLKQARRQSVRRGLI